MRPQLGNQAVLHLLPWLNYGGAEWHVIRLAGAQRARGVRVLVAGGGGRLEPELAKAGVPYRRLPFAGRHAPLAVWRLVRLLERERVGLLCAHNWRAATVGGLAARWARVPMLFTVHGLRHPAQRWLVPHWGRRVLAVSPQCREHLLRYFHLPPEQVLLVPVGVDLARFCPRPPECSLAGSLGLAPDQPVLLHASRLSRSKGTVALALVEAMPHLTLALPGLQLLIVGEGPLLGKVQAAAEEVNGRLGRRAISCLGGRSDLERLLSLAGVVVGTATVALEAMAAGKPVVAAGKAGYFGLITPDNLREAVACHFGDHGRLPPVSPARLAVSVREALERMPDMESRLGVEYVRSHHSPHAMVAAVEQAHREALGLDPQATVLVFHMNQVGDLVFSLPVLQALRAALPRGRIVSVARAGLLPLLRHCPLIDAVIDRGGRGAGEVARLAVRLRQERAQAALGLSQSPLTALLMWLSGAQERIGYVDSSWPWLLTRRVQWRGTPCPDKMLAILSALAIPVAGESYQGLLQVEDEEQQAADRLLVEEGLASGPALALLGPGASERRRHKTWGAERYAALAGRLLCQGWQVAIVGGPGEAGVGEEMVTKVPGVRNLAGKTTLGMLAALLGRAGVFVGGDSGPLHLAAAMGTRVVGIFGPTDPGRTAPQGEGHQVISRRLACSPCRSGCKDRRCLEQITVEEVAAAVAQVRGGPPCTPST